VLVEHYREQIDAVLARYPVKRSAVLPLLYLAQQAYGYCSEEAMREVAGLLGLEPTEVFSVAGFYSLFYKQPVGRYVLEICDDLPCALRGAEAFVEHVCRRLGVGVDETTPDGLFTVKTVMCLAACDKAPLLQCNLDYHENLTPETFDALLAEWRRQAEAGDSPTGPSAKGPSAKGPGETGPTGGPDAASGA
jgi:NADH-quinone oxidoreductase subunit E